MESVDGTRQTRERKIVFLFKSPVDNEADKFTETLEAKGFSCATIPVLSFKFVNQAVLRGHLSAIHLFSAVIFTSVRAVEAVARVAKELENEKSILQMQSFVVGKTTAEAARKYGFKPHGENSGNADYLAEYILKEVGSLKDRPILYPCSNLHRDTLREVLTRHEIGITEVETYETCADENISESLHQALITQGQPDYLVFFSPSGFQYTRAAISPDLLPLNNAKIIALGPSTYKSVCSYGLTPFGMAERPEPLSLLELLS